MKTLDLYSYFRSSSAYRVRLALYFKKVPFRYHAVHLLNSGGEQNQPPYLKLNPLAEVPTLQDGEFVLSQSMAILLYLDDEFPQPLLFPTEAKGRAKMIQLCETINSGIQPLQNLRVLQELGRRFGATQDNKDDWMRFWIHRGFIGLEKMLSHCAGSFSFGGQFSALDCYLIPQLYNAQRQNMDLNKYPTLKRLSDDYSQLEWVQRAHPNCQPDTPLELRS